MPDKARVGRFLRTLVGLLVVTWLVVALFAPPDPFTFLLLLVPGWVAATVAAAALVYLGGYARLLASPLFAPGASLSRATAAFVGLAIACKLGATLLLDAVLGDAAVGYAEGVLVSAVALAVAYVVVFYAGALGWIDPRRG